jgi:asparaginyl-tRNA synthetase
MTIATIADIGRHDGQEILLQGWLYNLRESGKLLFPQFRDGTGVIQGVVAKKEVAPEVFERVKHLTQESAVRVRGQVRADSRAPGGYELQVSDVEVIHQVPLDDPYPITLKEHGPDFLLERRHLWIRTPRQNAVLRVRHEVIKATRDFFDDQGFILVDTPIFTPNACEGTTTLFECDYDDEQKAYLTQSGQLYNEATCAALGKTYCFGPTFRAEKSKTRRHLREFWMVEPEMAFADLNDVMALSEGLVSYVVGRCLERRAAELKTLGRDTSKLESVKPPFPRISYDDAVTLLQRKGSAIEWGGDFGNADETLLGEEYDRPVIVHRYPAAIKAFYMQPDAERAELALGADTIAPEGYGEIIGGGQRIHDYELLMARIREHHLPPEAFSWYLDLRKYGSVPHAGFGMGIERVVAWICGLEHLREAIAFPRMLYRIYP